MINLTFTTAENGQHEAYFTAGQINILQLVFNAPAAGKSNSLSVYSRLGADMPWQLSKLFVPCPSRVVTLPVNNGELVKLITDLDITKAGLICNTVTSGGIDPSDVTALAELIEQNRLEIESQKQINDAQQRQIDKNTEVNEQQQQDLEQEYTNDDVQKLWNQVMK